MRNTRSEYFTSDMPSITDITRTCGNVRVVPQCMARPCGARRTSKINERESCNNVSGLEIGAMFAPGHHGYPRASRLTTGEASKDHFGTQSHGCAGQTVRPSLHSISQTRRERYVVIQSPFSVCYERDHVK